MEQNNQESKDTNTELSKELIDSLLDLSERDWEAANYPVISIVQKKVFSWYIEGSGEKFLGFWKEALNPDNLFCQRNKNKYDSKEHFLFVLHSFFNTSKNGKQDSIFKAITTTPESLLNDARNVINYRYHGLPCETRSESIYPTCDFWGDFYDNLGDRDKDKYPILDRNWRKKFIRENYFKK